MIKENKFIVVDVDETLTLGIHQLLLAAGQSGCAPRLERSAVHILGTR